MSEYYTIQYKVAVCLEKFKQPIEILKQEEFIDRIVLETNSEFNQDGKAPILITFFIPKVAYDNCQCSNFSKFFNLSEKEETALFKKWDNAKVMTSSGSVEITISTDIIPAIKRETALWRTRQVVNSIIDFIYFHFTDFHLDITSDSIGLLSENLPKCNEKFTFPFSSEFRIITGILPSLDSKISTLKEEFGSTENKNLLLFYSLFRLIKQKTDSISKFILFYSLLWHLIDGNQDQVDGFIESNSSYKRNCKRTVYNKERNYTEISYYRNEIGHTKPNTSIEEIKSAVERLLPALEELLKMKIRQMPPN